MNRADVALLDNQLDELGNSFLRNRQLQVENKRADADLSFRNAQMQHFANMEQGQEDRAAEQDRRNDILQKSEADKNDILEKRYGVQQAAQDLANGHASWRDSMGSLAQQVVAGKMSPQDANQYVRDSVDKGMSSNPQLYEQMLQQPDFRALYDGKMDWATIANQMAAQSKNKSVTGADEHLADSADAAQAAADAENDPNKKAELQAHAQQLGDLLKKRSGETLPPDKRQITVKPNPLGGPPTTNTVNTTYSWPDASSGAASGVQAPQIPIAPPDPGQRVVGAKYRSATNTNLVGTWTGQGFDTGTNAPPTQAVQGLGAAQPPKLGY